MSKVWSEVLTVSLKNCKNPGKATTSPVDAGQGSHRENPGPAVSKRQIIKKTPVGEKKIKFNLLIEQLNIPAPKSVCPNSIFL